VNKHITLEIMYFISWYHWIRINGRCSGPSSVQWTSHSLCWCERL